MRIQISTLRRLLHTSSAPTPNPLPLLDPVSVSNTISSYSNDPSRAIDFFHYVERVHAFSHDTRTFNAAIDVLAKFFDFDRAWSLIARMPSPSTDTFRILFNRYASARLPSDAIHAYERAASEFGLKREPLFTSLVDALCEHKHVIEAEELCFKRGDFPVTTKSHNMILRGYAKLGWWHKCREFWVDFEKGGILRDLHSYSIYMDIVIKSGKPYMAVKLFEEMIERGVRPDVVAYNTVIQAVGVVDGPDRSIRLFREMVDNGYRPNVATYNTILKLLCRAGRFDEAYGFLEGMRKDGVEPNVITYHSFFKYLMKPKEVMGLFDRMVKSGCQPRMDTYVMLLRKFGKLGFLRLVMDVWKAMEENGCSPDKFAYDCLIDALVKKGMLDMARRYDEEMVAKGLSERPRKELGTSILGGECCYEDHGVF
ncbi:Pentatricopeptide repeat-containing protein [Acorus gramineus]|uniref:Pentatricopeptide repeat-containing protein n=1 Tax=Acorus gramineus TaxID=55184 RepID=A0AAV9BH47_ACOGR|nr:Pentatricopeptide repeat-containing protein [Acorus gramineus]